MSVTVIINFEAAQGHAEALLAILQEGRDFGLTVDGCEAYDVYQGKEEPHKFALIERWTSVDAQQAHFENNVRASGVLDRVVTLTIEPPQGVYYLRR